MGAYIQLFYLVCEAIGTAANPGLLFQPRVIVKMFVEKQVECRLAGETEVLGENLKINLLTTANQTSRKTSWHDVIIYKPRDGG
jgi:hypothetical protein